LEQSALKPIAPIRRVKQRLLVPSASRHKIHPSIC
jgi:hypothetical protein